SSLDWLWTPGCRENDPHSFGRPSDVDLSDPEPIPYIVEPVTYADSSHLPLALGSGDGVKLEPEGVLDKNRIRLLSAPPERPVPRRTSARQAKARERERERERETPQAPLTKRHQEAKPQPQPPSLSISLSPAPVPAPVPSISPVPIPTAPEAPPSPLVLAPLMPPSPPIPVPPPPPVSLRCGLVSLPDPEAYGVGAADIPMEGEGEEVEVKETVQERKARKERERQEAKRERERKKALAAEKRELARLKRERNKKEKARREKSKGKTWNKGATDEEFIPSSRVVPYASALHTYETRAKAAPPSPPRPLTVTLGSPPPSPPAPSTSATVGGSLTVSLPGVDGEEEAPPPLPALTPVVMRGFKARETDMDTPLLGEGEAPSAQSEAGAVGEGVVRPYPNPRICALLRQEYEREPDAFKGRRLLPMQPTLVAEVLKTSLGIRAGVNVVRFLCSGEAPFIQRPSPVCVEVDEKELGEGEDGEYVDDSMGGGAFGGGRLPLYRMVSSNPTRPMATELRPRLCTPAQINSLFWHTVAVMRAARRYRDGLLRVLARAEQEEREGGTVMVSPGYEGPGTIPPSAPGAPGTDTSKRHSRGRRLIDAVPTIAARHLVTSQFLASLSHYGMRRYLREDASACDRQRQAEQTLTDGGKTTPNYTVQEEPVVRVVYIVLYTVCI
ncbi:hypothetical protein KIPB_011666, partial [Kipferlia bialata]